MYKVNFKISLGFIQYLGAKKLPNPLKQQEILHKLVDEIDKIVGLRAGWKISGHISSKSFSQSSVIDNRTEDTRRKSKSESIAYLSNIFISTRFYDTSKPQ